MSRQAVDKESTNRIGLFAGAEVNYKKAQNAKETITVTQSYTPKPTQSPVSMHTYQIII